MKTMDWIEIIAAIVVLGSLCAFGVVFYDAWHATFR